jgi:hypothetical protein
MTPNVPVSDPSPSPDSPNPVPEIAPHFLIAMSEQLQPGDFDKLLGTWAPPSTVGLFKENREIFHWLYSSDGKMLHRSALHLNNVGLFSRRDYRVERKAGEFRVAVMGDEQTASTLDTVSWPDLLQDQLNTDDDLSGAFPDRYFTVWNFGWPDSGFAVWERELREKVLPASPDLVVLNFAPHSFKRLVAGRPALLGGRSDIVAYPVGYRLSEMPEDQAFLLVFSAGPAAEAGVPSLRNPNCTAGETWQVFAPAKLMDDPAKVQELRRRISADYYAVEPGRRVAFVPQKSDPVLVDDLAARAAGHLRAMRQAAPHLLLARTPWISEVVDFIRGSEAETDWFTPKLVAIAPDLGVNLMADRIAAKYTSEEAQRFFLAFDRSKWSLRGRKVYAQEIAELIKERLLPPGTPLTRVALRFDHPHNPNVPLDKPAPRWSAWRTACDDAICAVVGVLGPVMKPVFARLGMQRAVEPAVLRALGWLRRVE